MTYSEMLEILRGKVLDESPEEIQQRLNEIADAIEQIVRERDAAVESGKELMATAQHAIKVRDAAVADLIRYTYCPVCLHFNMTVVDEPCKSCRNNGGSDDNWEWRGVQDE